MTIFVTGSRGMLGRALMAQLANEGRNVHGFSRVELDVTKVDQCYQVLHRRARSGDTVINCAGILPGGDPVEMIEVNAIGPRSLSWVARSLGFMYIHVSTDCVFEAHEAPPSPSRVWRFRPDEAPVPKTMYGLTKVAGEFELKADTVIRTSFVGPSAGVWRWLARQPPNAEVEGWIHSYWSGSTVWEVARAISSIINRPQGVIHLATAQHMTKYAVLKALAERLGREDITITPGGPFIDRTLRPTVILKPFPEALLEWNPT